MVDRAYEEFLASKAQAAKPSGFRGDVPDFLYPFQAELLDWALTMGRGLLLADCGLGKTPIELAWAENVVRHTTGRALILTPLAVGRQFEREGEKFGIHCRLSRDGTVRGAITVTNYEQVGKFSPSDFSGVVLDESSCLKNFSGTRRKELTEFLRTVPYRLLATATAAPNDFRELGTSGEALGVMGYMDMLATFFINDENSLHPTNLGARWRFKKAAEEPFWRWVCSWARAIRKPSDLGYADEGFSLPPLAVEPRYVENVGSPEGLLPGIVVEAVTLEEQRDERRRNLRQRCELAAEIAEATDEPVVIWTDFNAEADLLEQIIPDARQVAGKTASKESIFEDFAEGRLRVLITKPKIGAWGLNWQHCNRVIFFVSHSFEQFYQAVRRCWRYGQTRPVTVDVIATPGERRVLKNLQHKQERADRMFEWLVRLMNSPDYRRQRSIDGAGMEIPPWLKSKISS